MSEIVENIRVQHLHGNTEQNDNYIGRIAEVTADMEAKTLRLHDGIKPGGYIIGGTVTNTPPALGVSAELIKFTSYPPKEDDSVGAGVSATKDGEWIAVGIMGDDTLFTDTGAVDIYTKDGSGWRFVQKLLPVTTAINNYSFWGFRSSFNDSGDSLIISARWAVSHMFSIYNLDNGTWVFETHVEITGKPISDIDGTPIEWLSDSKIVTVKYDPVLSVIKAVIFDKIGSTWSISNELILPNGVINEDFLPDIKDISVTDDGLSFLVGGAQLATVDSGISNSWYCHFNGVEWVVKVMTPPPLNIDHGMFGLGAAISGNGEVAAISAPDLNTGGPRSGAVIMYYKTGNDFTYGELIKLPNIPTGSFFGFGVFLDTLGKTMYVTAPSDFDSFLPGKVFVLKRIEGVWTLIWSIESKDNTAVYTFGYSLAVMGEINSILVGVPFASVTGLEGEGAAFVIELK